MIFDPKDPEYLELVADLEACGCNWMVTLGSTLCGPRVCSRVFPEGTKGLVVSAPVTARVVSTYMPADWGSDYIRTSTADTVLQALRNAFDTWLFSKVACLSKSF